MATELEFRAMGSDCHVIVVGGGDDLAVAAKARIDDLEQRWSRFLPDSEVSELNRRAGEAVGVSLETVELVVRAVEAYRISGGSFDPTVLGAVIRAGYDRSFDELGPAPPAGVSLLGIGAADIEIDGTAVRLPAGTGFDPGGIGKGLAADVVTAEIIAEGAEGVCVNLGGDVRVTGIGPAGDSWTIAVDHPWSALPVALLGVAEGGVATSTTLKRRWQTGGQPRHHVIDPVTGLPSDTDLNLVTTVAAEAWVAEVLAKAVLLRGSAHPFDILGGTGAAAIAVDERGRVLATAGLADYLGDAALPSLVEPPS
jgi:thiamine biosynthesis lipoprotein